MFLLKLIAKPLTNKFGNNNIFKFYSASNVKQRTWFSYINQMHYRAYMIFNKQPISYLFTITVNRNFSFIQNAIYNDWYKFFVIFRKGPKLFEHRVVTAGKS